MLAGERYAAAHGVTTVHADFDFETYSEAGYLWDESRQAWTALEGIAKTKRGLNVVGMRNYVDHPSFRAISLAYNLKDGTGPRLWKPNHADPEDIFEHIRAGKLIEAWYVGFEFNVWTYFCHRVLGWPRLAPWQLRCAAAKAAQFNYPRKLEDAGQVLQLVNKKDPKGAKLIRKLTVPRNPSAKNPARFWTPETAPDDFAKFYAYNVTDIIAESEASLRMPDLTPRELEIWQTSEAINERGMQTDVVGRENCITIAEQASEKYNGELQAITHGVVKKYSEVKGTVAWLKTQGVSLDDLDEETVEDNLAKPHAPAVLRVLKIRQLLSFGSVKKLYAMRTHTCADGRLRNQYAYSAAHTHLWNGQDVQPANLYKGKLDKPEKVERALATIASGSLEYVERVYGDALECIADCLRSLIVAARGCRLIASDFAAIQAVITSALAGEEWRLEVFRTHGKIYEAMAASLTGKTVEFYIDYKKRTGSHHEDRQLYGKIPTLASDFGAWITGWRKFDTDGILGDDQAVKKLILKVWEKNPMICELRGGQTRYKFKYNEREELYGLEGAAIKAVKFPGECFGYRGVRYVVQNDILYCQPPGDCSPLIYHEPRLEKSRREYARPWELDLSFMGWNSNPKKGQGGWQRMKLYGGVLTQNVVAKLAREYQADVLMRCEKSGLYLPVMHTHDEAVTEVPLGLGSTTEYLTLVNQPRAGGYDERGRPWPIRAPGAEETQRYGKWE